MLWDWAVVKTALCFSHYMLCCSRYAAEFSIWSVACVFTCSDKGMHKTFVVLEILSVLFQDGDKRGCKNGSRSGNGKFFTPYCICHVVMYITCCYIQNHIFPVMSSVVVYLPCFFHELFHTNHIFVSCFLVNCFISVRCFCEILCCFIYDRRRSADGKML